MDEKTHLGFLRTHSDYLIHLTMQLRTLLTTMEQSFAETTKETPTDRNDERARLAELLQLFTTEANSFGERLKFFIAAP